MTNEEREKELAEMEEDCLMVWHEINRRANEIVKATARKEDWLSEHKRVYGTE